MKIDGFTIGDENKQGGPSPLDKQDRVAVRLKLKAGPMKAGYGVLFAWLHPPVSRHTHITYD
jgi:hypothetical protein